MDKYFEIKNKSDGVYVEVYPSILQGKNVDATEIANKLQELNIEFDINTLINGVENIDKKTLFKISDLPTTESALVEEENKEEEKNFSIYVSNDQMNITIKFFPPTNKDEFKLNLTEIQEELKRIKVAVPVNEELLLEIAKNVEYDKEYIIASGIKVIEAKEAQIEYFFKTEKDLRPEVDEDGNVNYKRLNVVAHVTKGQLLARLIPGEEGVIGKDVFGNEIRPKKVRVVKLKRGKNVSINDEQNELYAEVDGLVKLEFDKVSVNNTLEIPGNIGSSTGDIDFKGSIIINGNVMTGYTVIAKGDIEVLGVVEGAVVESGGNILLHRGIQGMSRSSIKAKGNVIARYIENGDVYAGGCIHSEAILHSNVAAKGEIKVEGKKGMITGGTVRSGTEVYANILGSHMGTITNIEVGIDPILLDEYNELKREYPKLIEDLEKLDQVTVLLNKRKEIDGELDKQKQEMYISAIRNKIVLSNKISLSEKRLEELKVEVERRNSGRVRVRNTVYPGVRVTIGTAKYYVRDEIKFVSMEKDGADVKLTSL